MHQQIIGSGPTVDFKVSHPATQIALHGAKNIDVLQRHGFKRGTRDMRGTRPSRQTRDDTPRVGIPVRRTQTGQSRHKLNATGIGYL